MDKKYIVVIGGINIDITGKASDVLYSNESNIGSVNISSGGVARNISDNLVKLGVQCELITALSYDLFSDMLKKSCKDKGISLKHSFLSEQCKTGTYLSLEDSSGSLHSAVCDLEIIENMPVEHIKEKRSIIENASVIVIDCNLPKDIIGYITKTFSHKMILADAVSSAKVIRLFEYIQYIDIVKVNSQEFKALFCCDFTDENASFYSKKYNITIVVTRGVLGSCAYSNGDSICLSAFPLDKIVSVNGAGDAYAAGLAFSMMNGYELVLCMRFASAMSYLTLLSETSVSEKLTIDKIEKIIKENE